MWMFLCGTILLAASCWRERLRLLLLPVLFEALLQQKQKAASTMQRSVVCFSQNGCFCCLCLCLSRCNSHKSFQRQKCIYLLVREVPTQPKRTSISISCGNYGNSERKMNNLQNQKVRFVVLSILFFDRDVRCCSTLFDNRQCSTMFDTIRHLFVVRCCDKTKIALRCSCSLQLEACSLQLGGKKKTKQV